MSDYCLVDAIEAGLTKIPRVPTSTDRSDDSNFRDIFSHTYPKQTSDFRPEITGNNTLLKEALAALYKDYETYFVRARVTSSSSRNLFLRHYALETISNWGFR